MSVTITINGTDYDVPSSAADTNWAADQVAFEQALNTYVASIATDLLELSGDVDTLGDVVDELKTIYRNVTPVGTGANTTEDDLMSTTVATMPTAAMGIRVTAWGDGVNTSDVTTLRAYFGATAVATKVLTASQANTWRCVFEVFTITTNTQTATGCIWNGGAAQSTVQANAAPIANVSGAVTVKFTGQRASSSVADSVRQLGMIIERFSAT